MVDLSTMLRAIRATELFGISPGEVPSTIALMRAASENCTALAALWSDPDCEPEEVLKALTEPSSSLVWTALQLLARVTEFPEELLLRHFNEAASEVGVSLSSNPLRVLVDSDVVQSRYQDFEPRRSTSADSPTDAPVETDESA